MKIIILINKAKKCLAGGLILLAGFSSQTLASSGQMKSTLVQIIAQLQAMKPLITKAKREQPSNPRIKIHFDDWKDSNGNSHNGLRQDIEAIQQGLIQAIHQKTIEPRHYAPIKNDFTSGFKQ